MTRQAMLDRWGQRFATPKGFLGKKGVGGYAHYFGGNRVEIVTTESPTLLVTLDLNDPKLSSLFLQTSNILPLCSHLNTNGWEERQVYQVINASQVKFLSLEISPLIPLEQEYKLPHPLPECPLFLEAMSPLDYPIDQFHHGEAFERFLGGESVIRVSGPPLFDSAITETCFHCHRTMNYVAAIGYDVLAENGLLGNRPFFYGEGWLYFFLCSSCAIIHVQSQGT